MVRKEYVQKIFDDAINLPAEGSVNPYSGKGLTPQEHDYLEKLIEEYDWSKVKTEIYEH